MDYDGDGAYFLLLPRDFVGGTFAVLVLSSMLKMRAARDRQRAALSARASRFTKRGFPRRGNPRGDAKNQNEQGGPAKS